MCSSSLGCQHGPRALRTWVLRRSRLAFPERPQFTRASNSGVLGAARWWRLSRLAAASGAVLAASACGSSAPATVSQLRAAASTATLSAGVARSSSSSAATARSALLEWPEFGLNPQRSDTTDASTGITAANVGHLRRVRIALPGTVDSSPIYLHEVTVDGATHDAIVVTTTYGKTLAIDASSGKILWTFTPPGYGSFAGSAQITTATPVADPDRQFVYAASPNGLIHKLSLDTGAEAGGGAWPVSVTRDPTHEKIAAALNLDGGSLLVSTGGYFGDIPPYQGHVVVIDRSSGRIRAIFNTLCSNRRTLIVPSSCPASDSAIWARAGAVVEPRGTRILLATGNGPWNGVTDFGDSALELSFPQLRLQQAFTPVNQQELNADDLDLGSGGPALLSTKQVLIGGKDGILRVLDLAHLDGHSPSSRETLGGEAQRLPTPGGGELITEPAVWHHGADTTVFVAESSGTGAYALRSGRLHVLWENGNPGTSPVMAGGLLYVYDPEAGGINVYRPTSARPIAKLPGAAGHWNSPIVVDGHVIEPEGDANEHRESGTLDTFSAH
jgi:DNA-binding beta-propeller fold protein YncE